MFSDLPCLMCHVWFGGQIHGVCLTGLLDVDCRRRQRVGLGGGGGGGGSVTHHDGGAVVAGGGGHDLASQLGLGHPGPAGLHHGGGDRVRVVDVVGLGGPAAGVVAAGGAVPAVVGPVVGLVLGRPGDLGPVVQGLFREGEINIKIQIRSFREVWL